MFSDSDDEDDFPTIKKKTKMSDHPVRNQLAQQENGAQP